MPDAVKSKPAEEALRESEERFRALLESAPVAIVIVDSRGRIVLVNAKTEAMFGYRRDELIGQALEILLPERFKEAHIGHRTHYLAKPRARPMGLGLDLAGRRKDGTEFPVEIGLGYTEIDGEVLAMSFITDITERRQVEQALQTAVTAERNRLARERGIRRDVRGRCREIVDVNLARPGKLLVHQSLSISDIRGCAAGESDHPGDAGDGQKCVQNDARDNGSLIFHKNILFGGDFGTFDAVFG